MKKAKVQTWLNNVANGNIKTKTEKILKCIIDHSNYGGIDTSEMRDKLGISHQTLTAILSNLSDEGVILVVAMKHQDKTGNVYSVYKFVEDEDTRNLLKQYRIREKIITWLNKGIEEYGPICSSQFYDTLQWNLERIKKSDIKEEIMLT